MWRTVEKALGQNRMKEKDEGEKKHWIQLMHTSYILCALDTHKDLLTMQEKRQCLFERLEDQKKKNTVISRISVWK